MPFNSSMPDGYTRRVTAKKKEASSFKRQRELLEYYDHYYSGQIRDEALIKKLNINYGLFNGRLPVSEYEDPISFNIGSEKITLEQQSIIHYPHISQVAKAMHGEQIARPFNLIAKEMGATAINAKKKKYNELLREYLQETVISPIEQRATQQYLQAMGVANPFDLSVEDQQQIEADIAKRSQAMTPKEISEFMSNDFQTPTTRQAQQLLDYLSEKCGLKDLDNEGFKHAIITGREIYYIDDTNGDPNMVLVNPMYFQWGGDYDNEWVQKGDWAKHEKWITFNSAVTRHGEHFKRGDWDLIEKYAEPMGGGLHLGDPEHDQVERNRIWMLSQDNHYVPQEIRDADVRTKDGQQKMAALYSRLTRRYGRENTPYGLHFGIREAHVAFRDLAKMYRITRLVNGKPKKFWVAENYTPTGKDIEVTQHWVPEVWEGTILGSYDPIYANIRRVPNQYKSIHNPYDVDLPYYGKDYDVHMNNAKGIAPVDLGKAHQRNIDIIRAELHHEMATDIGKVFVMVMDLKPDNIKWQDWYASIKTSKTILAQSAAHGSNPMDANMLKALDLSRTSAIAAKLQYIESERAALARAMYFNENRMGMGGQYSNTDTNEQNRAASFNQTEGFFDEHRKIFETAVNGLLNRARHILKDQPHKLDYIFDDVARADLELSKGLWTSELGVTFSMSNADREKVERLRSTTLSMLVQNGMSFRGILDLTLAETESDIRAISERENKLMQEKQQMEMQAAQQAQQQAQQLELQKEQAKLEAEQAFKAGEAQKDRDMSLLRTIEQAKQFQLQADVDMNGVADSIEKAKLDNEVKLKIADEKNKVEREKIEASKNSK